MKSGFIKSEVVDSENFLVEYPVQLKHEDDED